MVDTGLHGKVVLVTGGNNPSGIGAATARAFAAQGAAVFVHFFRELSGTQAGPPTATKPGTTFYRQAQASTADHVVEAIRSEGGVSDSLELDLADPHAVPALFDKVESTLGPVAVLVNNAALSEPDTFIPPAHLEAGAVAVDGFPLRALSPASVDRHFALNCRTVALMMSEFARRAVGDGRGGRIINVSTDGASGFASEVSYGASKYALESYSRAAAKELGVWGITVNVVSPGPIQTGWITEEMAAVICQRTPLGRVGEPRDVADVIVFLASDQARWLTGQSLFVGGGHRMPR